MNQDWLVYGLVGWSWGGFDLDNGSEAFVMNGFTYGGGVEKNFGVASGFLESGQSDRLQPCEHFDFGRIYEQFD